jgi:sirohydrochlorin ferrochelatase
MAATRHSLLIFHGSARETAGNAATVFADALKARDGIADFSICFLRGAKPSLEEAIDKAIADGYSRLHLIPLFLLPGSHIDEDIPAIVQKCRQFNPDITISLGSCLVHNPQFIKFVASEMAAD